MAAITRPIHGDLIIRMPYNIGNRTWLNDVAGRDAGVDFNKVSKTWTVKRSRFQRMIEALATRWGAVEVTQYGSSQSKCVPACWNGNPERVWECECSCAGSNHGSGGPHGKEVKPGLSVSTEYSEYTYVVTAE